MIKAFCSLFIFIFSCSGILFAQSFDASGGDKPVVIYQTVESTKLKCIFMFYGMENAQLKYTSPTLSEETKIEWYSYKENPDNRTKVASLFVEQASVIENVETDCGYIVLENGVEYAVWVVDYKKYIPTFQELTVLEGEDKCEYVSLNLTANIPEMNYYTFSNGSKERIFRKFQVEYQTLKWNSTEKLYELQHAVETINDINVSIRVRTPLVNTDFTLTEIDEFTKHFEIDSSVSSTEYEAIAVEVQAEAKLIDRDTENEKDKPGSGENPYMGSAPIEVDFIGNGSDAVRFYTWEFSSREDFSVLTASYPEQDLSYSFEKTGTYYVRLVVSDANNNCTAVSEVFTIQVTESFLDAPNFFTPNSTSGINDEFKVVYKSIDQFKCVIFNRWGNIIYEFNDPSLGWDGRKNGKLVPPGVYFYVIQAKGTDGIKYDLKGDINLIYEKQFSDDTSTPTDQ